MAKFTINNPKQFLNELNLLKLVAESKATIPVLACVKMEVGADSVRIIGTDLNNTLFSDVQAQTLETGEFVVHLQTLIESVKKAKTRITISAVDVSPESIPNPRYIAPAAVVAGDGDGAENAGNEQNAENAGEPETIPYTGARVIKVYVQADSASLTIEGTDPEQFPQIDDAGETTELLSISPAVLQDLLKKTVFAATNEQSRFTLNAVALEPGLTGLRIIGTDGHRAALADTKDFEQVKVKKARKSKKNEISVSSLPEHHLLNLDAARVLHKIIDGKVQIATDEKHLFITTNYGARRLMARKPDGNFPTYTMILLKSADFAFDLHPTQVKPIVENALGFADERAKCVAFQPYYNNLIVKSGTSERSFKAQATCDFPQNSAPALQFNGQYVIDSLNAAEKSIVQIRYKDSSSQFEISGESALCKFRFVIMPLSLGKDVNAAEYQIITDDEKADLSLVPFYKLAEPVFKLTEIKPDKKETLSDIKSLLQDIKDIAKIEGMPELFAEIVGDLTGQISEKLQAFN